MKGGKGWAFTFHPQISNVVSGSAFIPCIIEKSSNS